jgi:CRP-like cAMP-binding protein
MTRTTDGRIASAVETIGVEVKAYPHGGVVFVKDDAADCAYVVKSGAVEIREAGRALESVGPGEIFGEVAMIDEGPRSASAVAVGSTELYVVDPVAFDRLVRDDPDFAVTLLRDMARRLRVMNARQRPPSDIPVVPSRLARRVPR